MKLHSVILPVCLMAAGVLAGRGMKPQAEGSAEEKGLVRAVRQKEKAGAQTKSEPLSRRPDDPELAKRWDFLERLEKTPVEGFPAFWEEVEQAGNAEQNPVHEFSPEEILVAERWAELDPNGAVLFFLGRGDCQAMIGTVFGVWSQLDADAAASFLAKHNSPDLRETAAVGIFAAIVNDPAGMIAWGRRLDFMAARDMKADDFDRVIPPEAVRRAFDLDPAACRELAERMPVWFRERLEALTALQEAATNLPAALARLDTAGLTKESASRFFRELLPLAGQSPEKLLAVAEHLTERMGNGWLKATSSLDLQPMLLALARANPDGIHRVLANAASEDLATDMFRAEAAANVFETDPRLALRLAPSGTPWLSEFMGGPLVPRQLPGSPQETLELLRDAPSSMMRDTLLKNALSALMKDSADAVANWVESLPAGELRNVAQVTMENPDKPAMYADLARAVTSANSGTEDTASLARVRELTKMAVLTDPFAFSEQVMTLPEGGARDAAVQSAGKNWAYWSTPDALKWAEGLPESMRSKAAAGVLESWAGAEPEAASEYLAAHREEWNDDAPVAAFARGLAELNPAASMKWAVTVNDPTRRAEVLGEIAEGWLKKDAAAAREGIQNLPGLTADERQRLTNLAVKP
ncbi:MAG TPA: hypothetical protein VG796_17075 [Verrucomicrobiales bacterium]|nr:hypothetical protein [Verrucomicrobiales bacterium]